MMPARPRVRISAPPAWLDQLSSVILASVLATLIWLVANESALPMDERQVPQQAADGPRIEFRNVPPGWAVYDPDPRRVRLVVRGVRDALPGLSPGDFEVWADLGGTEAQAGAHEIPIAVRCTTGCRRKGVRVREVVPRSVTVHLGHAVTRTETVDVMPQDELPKSYRIAEKVIVPLQVEVLGAAPAMARLDRVAAVVAGLGEVHGERHFATVPVVALDAAGEPLEDVQVSPPAVDVTVRMRKTGVLLAVVANIQGGDAVADGYFLSSFFVDPKVVEVEGPPNPVRELGNEGLVHTEAVDLTGEAGEVRKLVSLDLPDGVTALNAPAGVTVTVRIDPLPGTATLDVTVESRRLGPGLSATVTPERVQVLLSGPRPELETLRSTDIEAYVDLAGLTAGTHRLRVRVEPPVNVRVRSITPEELEVVVRQAADALPTPAYGTGSPSSTARP